MQHLLTPDLNTTRGLQRCEFLHQVFKYYEDFDPFYYTDENYWTIGTHTLTLTHTHTFTDTFIFNNHFKKAQ